jgi:hypothetical protein
MQASEIAKVYETLLSIPGMNDEMKVSLKISRKNILLLSQVIENGVAVEGKEQTGILSVIDNETKREISQIASDILEKSGMKAMKDKLSAFQSK